MIESVDLGPVAEAEAIEEGIPVLTIPAVTPGIEGS